MSLCVVKDLLKSRTIGMLTYIYVSLQVFFTIIKMTVARLVQLFFCFLDFSFNIDVKLKLKAKKIKDTEVNS